MQGKPGFRLLKEIEYPQDSEMKICNVKISGNGPLLTNFCT